jgi:hypothetical protein
MRISLSRDRVGSANIVQHAEAAAASEDTMTTTRYLSVVAILCGLLGCAPVAAAPVMTGRQVIDINGAPMVVFTYRPPGCSDPSLLMIFHGVARNARTYRDDARAMCDYVPAVESLGFSNTGLATSSAG